MNKNVSNLYFILKSIIKTPGTHNVVEENQIPYQGIDPLKQH